MHLPWDSFHIFSPTYPQKEEEAQPTHTTLLTFPIFRAQINPLPNLHGSAIFRRGETHVLCSATLDSPRRTRMVGCDSSRKCGHSRWPFSLAILAGPSIFLYYTNFNR